MTLLESYKTMNTQQEIRMEKWSKEVMYKFEGEPGWTHRETAKFLTPLGDSQIHQNNLQRNEYLCKVINHTVSYGEIHMIRSKKQDIYCEDCTKDVSCEVCSELSPITKFRRRRKIFFHKSDVGVKVVCCPYQTTYGIICRHLSVLLKPTSKHTHVRWKLKLPALYHRKGYENEQLSMKKKLRDHSLIISTEEYDFAMSEAKKIQESIIISDKLFDSNFENYQKESEEMTMEHSKSKDQIQFT